MLNEHEPGRDPRPPRSGPAKRRGRWGSQGPFACPECDKAFERKEYRDKHHRRCLKAAAGPRQTRQRSCVSCVASKLGCDQKHPSCSRCVLRGKRCQYAAERGSSGQDESLQRQGSVEPESERLSQVLPSYSTFDKIDSLYPPITPDPGEGIGGRLLADMNASSLPSAGTATQVPGVGGSGNNYQTWPLDPQLQSTQQGHSPDRAMKDANLVSDWLRRSPPHGFLPVTDPEPTSQWPTRTWPSRSPSVTMGEATSIPPEWDEALQLGMNNEMHFDLLGSLGVLPRNNRSTPGGPQRPPVMMQSPKVVRPVNVNTLPPPVGRESDTSVHNLSTAVATNQAASKERSPASLRDIVPTTRESRPLPETENESPTSSCPFHRFTSDHETVQIICSYPRLMLRPGIYPPFVHHRIYPCAEGEILEPLAKAFCCVGAFYASVRTSESFVYSLMNNESRRLVNGFQLWSNSDSSMLAAVHAMCIYQILGFFSCTNPEQTRLAELQQLFFLKMVRKLITTHLQPGTGDESEKVNWRKWIMNETIRRTVFLANMINTLSYRTQKQNPFYYEALNDEVVMNMTLPAPLSVWKASSTEEWLAAKGRLSPEELARSEMTVQSVVDQFDGQQAVTISGRNKGRGRTDRVQFESLDEFTRLVIATARIYR